MVAADFVFPKKVTLLVKHYHLLRQFKDFGKTWSLHNCFSTKKVTILVRYVHFLWDCCGLSVRFFVVQVCRTIKIGLLGSKTSTYMPTTSIVVARELKTMRFMICCFLCFVENLLFWHLNGFTHLGTIEIGLPGSKTSTYMPTTSIFVARELKIIIFVN